MAHFAEIDASNVVQRVIVVGNEQCLDSSGVEREEVGAAFCKTVFPDSYRWVQTSYNRSFRGNFASVGYLYMENEDIFMPVKPYSNWIVSDYFEWIPPIPKPTDGKEYEWDQENTCWVIVVPEDPSQQESPA